MRRRLPPLNPLRAFEASARHLSFTIAAEELAVTQVAVSKQVKVLEDRLGVELFKRSHRTITLTSAGERFLIGVQKGFDEIERATELVMARGHRDVLNLQAYTTFAQRWIMPLLGRFHEEYPKIEVRLTASLASVDFDRQAVDAAIRSGLGDWKGMEVDYLAPIDLIPVASPKFIERYGPINSPEELEHFTLLHSLARPDDWEAWLQAEGCQQHSSHSGLKFESSSLAYEAAMQGMGIAMGIKVLVEQNIQDGTLMPVLDICHRQTAAYYLVRPAERSISAALKTFREYLLGKVVEKLQH